MVVGIHTKQLVKTSKTTIVTMALIAMGLAAVPPAEAEDLVIGPACTQNPTILEFLKQLFDDDILSYDLRGCITIIVCTGDEIGVRIVTSGAWAFLTPGDTRCLENPCSSTDCLGEVEPHRCGPITREIGGGAYYYPPDRNPIGYGACYAWELCRNGDVGVEIQGVLECIDEPVYGICDFPDEVGVQFNNLEFCVTIQDYGLCDDFPDQVGAYYGNIRYCTDVPGVEACDDPYESYGARVTGVIEHCEPGVSGSNGCVAEGFANTRGIVLLRSDGSRTVACYGAGAGGSPYCGAGEVWVKNKHQVTCYSVPPVPTVGVCDTSVPPDEVGVTVNSARYCVPVDPTVPEACDTSVPPDEVGVVYGDDRYCQETPDTRPCAGTLAPGPGWRPGLRAVGCFGSPWVGIYPLTDGACPSGNDIGVIVYNAGSTNPAYRFCA